MADHALTPRSPFAALAPFAAPVGPSPPGVVLAEASPAAMVALAARRGGEAALRAGFSAAFGFPLPQERARTAGEAASVVWMAPGQWLVLGGRDLPARLADAVRDGASLIDATGGRVVVAVRGPRAEAALQKLLPIDLDPRAFPADAAASTVAAHLTVQVWRLGPEAFELATGRSFALGLWRALVHAGEEFGIAQDLAGRG